MKKIGLIILALITTLYSCSSDDNMNVITADTAATIPGTWNVTQLTVDNGEVDTGIPLIGNLNFTIVGKDFDQTIVFDDMNTFTSEGGYTAIITTSILGESSTQEQVIDDFFGTGDWSLEENTITFTTTENVTNFTILSITNTTLVLEVPLNQGSFDLGSFTSGIPTVELPDASSIEGTAIVTLTK